MPDAFLNKYNSTQFSEKKATPEGVAISKGVAESSPSAKPKDLFTAGKARQCSDGSDNNVALAGVLEQILTYL